MKTITILYQALLREQRGIDQETVQTETDTAAQLFDELARRHGFRYGCGMFQVVINGTMSSLRALVNDGDTVTFLPPLGGG